MTDYEQQKHQTIQTILYENLTNPWLEAACRMASRVDLNNGSRR